MNWHKKGIILAAGLSLVWCQVCLAAPQKSALKAIDPNTARTAAEPAPPPPSPPPTPPLGKVEGAPLAPKRTLANPNPDGISFLKEDQSPRNPYGTGYGQPQSGYPPQQGGYQPYGPPGTQPQPGYGAPQQFQQPPGFQGGPPQNQFSQPVFQPQQGFGQGPGLQPGQPPAFQPNQPAMQPPAFQPNQPPAFQPAQPAMQPPAFQPNQMQPPAFQPAQPAMQPPVFQPNQMQPPAFQPAQPAMQPPAFQPNQMQPPAFQPNQPAMQPPAFQPNQMQPPAFQPNQPAMQPPAFQPNQMQPPAFQPNQPAMQPPAFQPNQMQPPAFQPPQQAGFPQGPSNYQQPIAMPSPSGFPGGSASGPGFAGQQFPSDNMIPQFGQPLPLAPPTQAYNGPGFGPSQMPMSGGAPAGSPDENRAGALEQIAFGTTYPEHEVEDRVDHLEVEVFGNKNKAGSLADRLQRLESKLGVKSAFGGSAPPAPPPQTAYVPPTQPAPWMQQPPKAVPSAQPSAPLSGPSTPPAAKTSPPVTPQNDQASAIASNIPEKKAAGDFFAQISRFDSGTVARWTGFPVLVHLPGGSPDAWQKMLEQAVSKWNQFIPVRAAAASEPADVEVAWINHLPPRQLGLTNLEVFNGRMRVTIYLLRPSYYLPSTPEKTLAPVAQHEIGHALGLFGHSSDPQDAMYPIELPAGGGPPRTKSSGITPRDLNTLKRIYQTPPLPPGYQTPHPMGWSNSGNADKQ